MIQRAIMDGNDRLSVEERKILIYLLDDERITREDGI